MNYKETYVIASEVKWIIKFYHEIFHKEGYKGFYYGLKASVDKVLSK